MGKEIAKTAIRQSTDDESSDDEVEFMSSEVISTSNYEIDAIQQLIDKLYTSKNPLSVSRSGAIIR